LIDLLTVISISQEHAWFVSLTLSALVWTAEAQSWCKNLFCACYSNPQ